LAPCCFLARNLECEGNLIGRTNGRPGFGQPFVCDACEIAAVLTLASLQTSTLLGQYPALKSAEARKTAAKLYAEVRLGNDPAGAKAEKGAAGEGGGWQPKSLPVFNIRPESETGSRSLQRYPGKWEVVFACPRKCMFVQKPAIDGGLSVKEMLVTAAVVRHRRHGNRSQPGPTSVRLSS